MDIRDDDGKVVLTKTTLTHLGLLSSLQLSTAFMKHYTKHSLLFLLNETLRL